MDVLKGKTYVKQTKNTHLQDSSALPPGGGRKTGRLYAFLSNCFRRDTVMRIPNNLFNLFFPRLCVLCKEMLIEKEEHICLNCLSKLHYTDFFIYGVNTVAELFSGKVDIEKATSFLHYRKGNYTKELIFSIKYGNNKSLAHYLGRLAARALKPYMEEWPEVDLLIPVPLHPKRERERGYNQSEWICRGLASVLDIPVHAKAILRHRYTRTQTSKDRDERLSNVRDAFCICDPEALKGRHVLLVDDVITSSATVSGCVQALLTVPGIRISVFSIASA
jgi:ComF family protein